MKHSKLKTFARKLMTHDEIKRRVGIFASAGWERHKAKIQKEVIRREAAQQHEHPKL